MAMEMRNGHPRHGFIPPENVVRHVRANVGNLASFNVTRGQFEMPTEEAVAPRADVQGYQALDSSPQPKYLYIPKR